MNLYELLSDAGIDYRIVGEHHHATHGWLSVDCPFCSPSSGKFRLGLNPRSRAASCWTCGIHPFFEVLKELTGSSQYHLFSGKDEEESDFSPSHLSNKKPGKLLLPEGLGPLLPIHRQYLQSRGFNPYHLVQLWGLQGFGLHHRFPWNIFIPIFLEGKIVSWLTRNLAKTGQRYTAAGKEEEAIPAKSILFGIDYVRYAAILCEGPFDVFRIGPGAVCSFGMAYTQEQLCMLANIPIRIVCFDAEPEAQNRARELCRELAIFPGETSNIVLESGKDPAEASEEEIQEIRKTFLEE